MTFGEAMVAVEAGRRIRRASWDERAYAERGESAGTSVPGATSLLIHSTHHDVVRLCYPTQIDMRATDWEVVE